MAKPSAWSRSAARHGGHEPAPDALVAHMCRKSTRREKEKGALTAMFARCSRDAWRLCQEARLFTFPRHWGPVGQCAALPPPHTRIATHRASPVCTAIAHTCDAAARNYSTPAHPHYYPPCAAILVGRVVSARPRRMERAIPGRAPHTMVARVACRPLSPSLTSINLYLPLSTYPSY